MWPFKSKPKQRVFQVYKVGETVGTGAAISMGEFRTNSIVSVSISELWMPVGCTEFSLDLVQDPIERDLKAAGIGEFVGHSQRLDGVTSQSFQFLVKDEFITQAIELIRYRLELLGAPETAVVRLTPKPEKSKVVWE